MSLPELKLFNTASRSVEPFVPITGPRVGMYACGPTVYNFAHIGNLRTYIFEDILRRVLERYQYDVVHVMNITDVGHLQSDADIGDDKLTLAALREQRSPWQIAFEYEQAFFRHCAALNIKRPVVVCRATDHIAEMIDMVAALIDKGFAYVASGNVYFDVSCFERYPDFARLNLANQVATDRVSHDPNKRDQMDFALWFSDSKYPHQIMKWDSPWGVGFPGWHIECSAMSSKYLGTQFDIHCGGIDHVSVHHTNEIAQSDCCHGHKSVNYWLHGAFLTLGKGKMSKSENRFITVDTLVEAGYDPLAFRYLTLSTHYRSELAFSYEALDAAVNSLNTIREKVQSWRSAWGDGAYVSDAQLPLAKQFRENHLLALANDLHMPSALANAWAMMRSLELEEASKLALIYEFDEVFGLRLQEVKVDVLSPEEAHLISLRNACRDNGDWDRADLIRDQLLAMGIRVKDTKKETEWSRV